MRVGLDIGSTTIKCVVLNDAEQIVYSTYERHYSHILEKGKELLHRAAQNYLPDGRAKLAISGSAGMGLADSCKVPFVQEVFATRVAANKLAPGTDCIIELGGEDAKILFLTNGTEVRMNGSCAGGTGAFIDQMATLLKMSADEMDKAAQKSTRTYTIASRCGVFAKSDIQPLINQGAQAGDIAASIYQAVVNQTIAGLAQGRPIKGNILYLGGPLTFSTVLRKSFDETLHVTGTCPENSLLYVALGAAFYADQEFDLNEVASRLDEYSATATYISLPPLFKDKQEYEDFHARHLKASVPCVPFGAGCGPVHIGIDSGSTTIKLVVIDQNDNILFTSYQPNLGNPLPLVRETLLKLYQRHPGLQIASVTTTGYGEELVKNAFHCDRGLVETVAHFTAAKHFMPNVDFIIDIGGQDMKCFKIEDGAISNIFLNEACSSGCGSFLQTFAQALGYDVKEFAALGLFADKPVDLGSRCTVFMNSSVKQAQKDGASIENISAGLSISVVKNALYKVIRASSPKELGRNIVVQGGTFYNEAVLRAFEKEMGVNVIRPDIAGLMGAYGAALYGKARAAAGQMSTVLTQDELEHFEQKVSTVQCGGCGNHCQLTINVFADGKRYISGNRCDKPVTGKATNDDLNLYAYKLKLLLDYKPENEGNSRGVIGIPLCLNMYELLPFWHTFFTKLGFTVKVSPVSSRKLYQEGQATIPSDTACFPAKLSHGHIAELCKMGVDAVFYPCMSYNVDEHLGDNHYNCPVVAYYPEVLVGNCPELENTKFIYDYINLARRKDFTKRFPAILDQYFPGIPVKEVHAAIDAAYDEYEHHMTQVRAKGAEIIARARAEHRHIIVLAGRPYHVDPEVNHGIDKLIIRQGAAVVTEDSVSCYEEKFDTAVLNQWTYHSRLYAAAKYCTTQPDMDLVQLVSFGCGLDAVTTDQVHDILTGSGKIYTVLKIDEVNNLGAARIRIRSLIAALRVRDQKHYSHKIVSSAYNRVVFTKEMKKDYTLLCPQMSPIHFDLIEPAIRAFGYKIEVLKNDSKKAVDVGLQYVNNDACYPSLIVVGQIMDALLSGKYDLEHTAVIMSQTGGGCRASNYIGFIRRALERAGMTQIPVISLNANGMETNPGFKITLPLLTKAMQAVVYGDLFMRVLYATRPYEAKAGSANALHEKWKAICIKSLQKHSLSMAEFNRNIRGIIHDFDELPRRDVQKPRVGIVGEILVKFSPLANNHVVELLEAEGAEAVMPDLLDFLLYCFYNSNFKADNLGGKRSTAHLCNMGISLLEYFRRTCRRELERSTHFLPPARIQDLASMAKHYVSLGNQTGEGWFLTGEMLELIHSGTTNIICTQPFGCLPNHIVGKGVIKELRASHPEANIIAVDYDPGASEVNQLNRIKLMLSTAQKNLSEGKKDSRIG